MAAASDGSALLALRIASGLPIMPSMQSGPTIAVLATLALLATAGAVRADSRFFLFVSTKAPSQSLVDSALTVAQSAGPPVAPDVSRERMTRAFPQLFGSATGDRGTIESELSAGTAAHYATNFRQAEVHLARAFELAYRHPELLESSETTIQRLTDGAMLRYANATAASEDVPEAERRLREFARRFPKAEPTRTDHPPRALEQWDKLHAEVLAETAQLSVTVLPLELERTGTCKLILNGANVATLPMAGPLVVPVGEQMLQVRCGLQRSWMQRVELRREPLVVRVPVRAMMSARAEARSGGVVMTAPEQGDPAALIEAICDATRFDGAIIVQTAPDVAYAGRWERGSLGPSIELKGDVERDSIIDVKRYSGASSGGGRVWTWVAGGVGLAAIAGGVVANVLYADEVEDAYDADKANSLQTAATALYITGGALLVTSVILFFVEGGDSEAAAASLSTRAPGSVLVRF